MTTAALRTAAWAALTGLVVAATAAAQTADAPPAAEDRTSIVRVRVMSAGGRAAPEGVPVELTVMAMETASRPFAATTDPTGTAKFVVPLPTGRLHGVLCMATLRYGDIVFVSEAARLGPDDETEPLELTLRVWPPSGQVPTWSYLALASLWVMAVGLVVFRKSDEKLT